MTKPTTRELKDGDYGLVVAGTHTGKAGTIHDIHASKSGNVTVTVRQKNGVRFKTLAKNVVVQATEKSD